MKLTDLSKALAEHNSNGGGYQIHLNSENLEEGSKRNTDIEFGDLYFTDCSVLKDTTILSFGNMSRKPIDQKEDGTPLYPSEINSNLFVDLNKIEAIEEVKDFQDWFAFPSIKVINLYMHSENNSIGGNILTIGFM